jgi:hypothetical protein
MLGVLAASAASAQTEVRLEPIGGPQAHALTSISYAAVAGAGPVLSVRSQPSILCAPSTDEPATGSKAVIVDPNGYLPSYPVVGRSTPDELPMGDAFPAWARFRTSSRLAFVDMLYPVDPVEAPNVVAVGGIQGNCMSGAAPQPNPPPAPACTVVETTYEVADRIATRGFERPGTAQLYSRVVANTPGHVFYEHTVMASEGPVSGLKLREQFPYHLPGAVPVFKTSLDIESAWVCHASPGAQCIAQAHSDAGMGYAQLDSASLEAGECLRITAMRPVSTGAGVDSAFSGTINAMLFVPGQDANGAPQATIRRTRLDLD